MLYNNSISVSASIIDEEISSLKKDIEKVEHLIFEYDYECDCGTGPSPDRQMIHILEEEITLLKEKIYRLEDLK